MNVLILTAGSRVQTVTYFKRALAGRGRVITTDASELAPALYAADGHHVVPLITDPEYLPTILRICRDEDISVALSLLDPELSLLAEHVDDFEAVGTAVMISPAEVVERAFDKWLMYQWLTAEGLPTPRSWIDLGACHADLDAGVAAVPAVREVTDGFGLGGDRTDRLAIRPRCGLRRHSGVDHPGVPAR